MPAPGDRPPQQRPAVAKPQIRTYSPRPPETLRNHLTHRFLRWLSRADTPHIHAQVTLEDPVTAGKDGAAPALPARPPEPEPYPEAEPALAFAAAFSACLCDRTSPSDASSVMSAPENRVPSAPNAQIR